MTIDPAAFTHDWIAAWNRRDIEAVLAHCAETVVVVTPKAEAAEVMLPCCLTATSARSWEKLISPMDMWPPAVWSARAMLQRHDRCANPSFRDRTPLHRVVPCCRRTRSTSSLPPRWSTPP